MKYFKILIVASILIACENIKDEIDLNISNKDLHKIFYGNKYYQIKGVRSNNKNLKYRLSKPNLFLNLESKFKIKGFNNLIISEDSLNIFINEAKDFPVYHEQIKFNNYISKIFFLIPIFSLENLELIGLRNTNLYQLNEKNNLIPYYNTLGIENQRLEELTFYEKSVFDLNQLEKIGIYPESLKSLYFIENPFTKLYSIIPDLRYFTKTKNLIISRLINQLNVDDKKHIEKKIKSRFNITRDTIIDKNLIIKSSEFKILNNSNITLTDNAKLIIDQSIIDFSGEKNDSIRIIGQDNNSILIRNCEKVNFSFCSVNGLSGFSSVGINLPSSLTFYNSKVVINNTMFQSNYAGDDYINFFYSDFKIDNSNFEKVKSDAVDSDFSSGSISNSNFKLIGNDAIDFSGSNVSLFNLNFYKINDKAISVGENSNINANNLKIFDSEIGIVVKDGSSVITKNVLFENNMVNYCSFMKKNFYDYPILNIRDTILIGTNLIEENTILKTSNNNITVEKLKNVEDLLYGNLYGKSSK